MQSFQKRTTALIAASLIVTAVTGAAPAGAKRVKVPTHGGRGCSMLNSLVDSPDPLVRPHVPDRFTTRSGYLPGHTGLVVNTLTCEDVTVNGKSFGPTNLSVFWVFVEAPDGSSGDHLYEAWRLTDNRRLAHALARYGVGLDVAGVSLETQPPTPAGTITESAVEWDGGSSYTASGIEPAAAVYDFVTQPYAYTLWQLNDGGLVTMPIVENFTEPSSWTEVDGHFTAEPGSPLAQMIGASQVTNHALFTDYEFDIEILTGAS